MKIEFETSELFNDEGNEFVKLKHNLGINNDPKNKLLEEKLVNIAKAAFSEYIDMFIGIKQPTKASEYREIRVLKLMEYYFNNSFPLETEIMQIFSLTNSASKSLLRTIRAGYKYEIESTINRSIKNLLELAVLNENEGNDNIQKYYKVVIESTNILEEMKFIICKISPQLDQIKKLINSISTYLIPEDTYLKLKEYLSN